jgi:uncharacterized protein (DUF488 family)
MRSLAKFVDLLQASGIRALADVRRFPRSSTNPQFNLGDRSGAGLCRDFYRHIAERG